MSEILRFNLSEEFADGEIRKGTLESAFERAINFRFAVNGEQRLVTILKEGVFLLPDSIIVSPEMFVLIKNNLDTAVTISDKYFSIKDRNISLGSVATEELFLPNMLGIERHAVLSRQVCMLNTYIQKKDKVSNLKQLPVRYEERVGRFADSLLRADREGAEYEFGRLVGAGKGLTPACDDAIVGVLAAMCFFLAFGNPKNGYTQYRQLTKGILSRLITEKITTTVSAKYLKCVCRGYVSAPVGRLLKWIFEEDDIFPAEDIEQIMQMGHTSGMDTLYGIQCALACIEGVEKP